jgi:hypothetical protein
MTLEPAWLVEAFPKPSYVPFDEWSGIAGASVSPVPDGVEGSIGRVRVPGQRGTKPGWSLGFGRKGVRSQAGSVGGSGPPVLWHPDIAHPCRSPPRFRAVLNRRPVASRSRGAAKRSGPALSQSEPARGLRLALATLPLANPLRSHRRTGTCESHRPHDGSF